MREGDTFTVPSWTRLARSLGDLLEMVARLEAKKVSLRVAVHVWRPTVGYQHGDRQVDAGCNRRRGAGRAGSAMLGEAGGKHRQGPKAEGTL